MTSRYRQLNRTRFRVIAVGLVLEIVVIAAYGVASRLSFADSSARSSSSAALADSTCAYAARAPNPVAAENTCPGTSSWERDLPLGPSDAIEAFPAPVSVNAGGSVNLYVSTWARSYSFRVYRMGWYGGLGGRLMYSSPQIQGISQPKPTVDQATDMASASNWHDPVTVQVPTTWVSGVYVVKLVSSSGYMRYTSFAVRNDASHSAILFQSSVMTYQAYNTWGEASLYQINPDQSVDASHEGTDSTGRNRAFAVSFDRPLSGNAGLADFTRYEYNLLRWLERQGYDVTYTTDVDTDLRGQLLPNHRLFLAAGHDEYWSTAMHRNVTQARDSGISLAFFGANDAFWHVRLQDSALGPDRVIVCYKLATLDPAAAHDPASATAEWRDPPLNQREDALLGAMYLGIAQGAAPLVLASGAAPFLKGTALLPGSAIAEIAAATVTTSTSAGEFDGLYPDRSSPVTVIASSPVRAQSVEVATEGTNIPGQGLTTMATSTLYTAPSGARVFVAGTFWWGLGLDDKRIDTSTPQESTSNPDFQQLTANLLEYLIQPPSK